MKISSNYHQKLTLQKIENILKSRFEKDGFLNLSKLPDPNLFKDMQKATKKISKSNRKKRENCSCWRL